MKVPQPKEVVSYSNITNPSQQMGITMSGKMFSILSSSLYAHKERAIIRELSTNAWDAHQEAGTQDIPFEIQLPTNLLPVFRIRDFGTGMSEEKIFSVYNRLFESTKTNTNEQTGMLGLGSKTPFAYTDSVTITSYQDGVKKIYNSLMGSNGVPATVKVFEGTTEEKNGLEVQFGVNSTDCQVFIAEAEMVFLTFMGDPHPKFLNTNLSNRVSHELDQLCDNVYFSKTKSAKHSDFNVIQGNVSYPINWSMLDHTYRTQFAHVSYLNNVFIKVPIGTVDFQPSREGLTESKENYDKLKPYLKGVDKHFHDFFRKKYSHIKHPLDAKLFLLNKSNGIFSQHYFDKIVVDENKVNYNADNSSYQDYSTPDIKMILDKLNIEVVKSKSTMGSYYKRDRFEILQWDKNPPRPWNYNGPVIQPNYGKKCIIHNLTYSYKTIEFVLVDDSKKFRKKINAFYKDTEICRVQIINSEDEQQAVTDFLAYFPGMKVVKTSEMPDPPKSAATPRVIKREWWKSWKNWRDLSKYGLDSIHNLVEDPEEPFYYLTIDSYASAPNIANNWWGLTEKELKSIINELFKLKIIENKEVVVIRGAKEAEADIPKLFPTAVPLRDAIKNYVLKKFPKDSDYEVVVAYSGDKNAKDGFFNIFNEALNNENLNDYNFGDKYLEILQLGAANFYDKIGKYFTIGSFVYNKTDLEAKVKPKLKEFQDEVLKKFPLLKNAQGNLNDKYTLYNVKKLLRKAKKESNDE